MEDTQEMRVQLGLHGEAHLLKCLDDGLAGAHDDDPPVLPRLLLHAPAHGLELHPRVREHARYRVAREREVEEGGEDGTILPAGEGNAHLGLPSRLLHEFLRHFHPVEER